jgi:hypothetical protein
LNIYNQPVIIEARLKMKRQRRLGEALFIAGGGALAGIGGALGILSLVAGGLAIAGLGVISFFWR